MMNDESTQGNDEPTTKGKRRWPKVVAGITAGCVMAVLLCPTLLTLGLAEDCHDKSNSADSEPQHCEVWAGDYYTLGGGYDRLTLKADCSMEGTKTYDYGYVFDYVPGSFTGQGNGINAFRREGALCDGCGALSARSQRQLQRLPGLQGRFELQPTKDSPTGVMLYFASRDGLKSDDSDMHNYLAPEGYTGYRGGDAKDDAPEPHGREERRTALVPYHRRHHAPDSLGTLYLERLPRTAPAPSERHLVAVHRGEEIGHDVRGRGGGLHGERRGTHAAERGGHLHQGDRRNGVRHGRPVLAQLGQRLHRRGERQQTG